MTLMSFLPRRARLLACTAFTAIAIASPAKADPISAVIVSVASAIGVTTTIAAVNTFLISTALSFGASMISSALRKGSNAGGTQERQASITTINVGETPREYVFGRVCTAGTLLDGFNYGGQYGTDWECLVIDLASHAVDALEGFWIYDRYYAFTANGIQAWSSGGLDIQFVNATAAGSAPPARFSAAGWASTDRCAGETVVWFAYSAKFVDEQGGRPQPRFVLRGKRLYDPRKDSTVPGGSGAHRWATPSTYEWSENLELSRYNWERGIYAGDQVTVSQHLWVGRGLSAVEAPPQAIFAAANLCDEAVALKAGGTQPRYHGGGVIRADEDFASVEQMFANCMGGVVVQREGGVLVEPGAAKAVVMEITDADLVVGEPVNFDSFLAAPDRVNTVVPRYIEPAQRWNDHSAPVRRSIVDIQTDGRPNETEAELALITHGVRAQRIGEIGRRLGRFERRAGITLGPRFAPLEEGDWIGWTSNRYHNGGRVVYRVERYGRAASWRKTLQLREIAASAFSWTAATDEITPGAALPPEPGALDPVALSGVTLQGVSKNGAPGIRATYATPVDPAVEGIRLEVRQLGQAEATPTMTRDLSGAVETTSGVAPDSTLQVRLLPMTAPHRAVAVVAWTTLTSAELIAGKIVNQGPGATDPRDPDDIAGSRVFASRVALTAYNSTTNRRYGLSGATASVPPGQNTGKIRLTRTGDAPFLFMNASNFEGLDGAYLNVIRAKVRAVVDEPIADQWRGLVYVYGSFAGSPKTKSVPFPVQKNGSDRMPTTGSWPWVEWDFSDDPDFEGATITQIRFYLIPPFTAGSGKMDIDQLLVGSRTSDALGLPGGNVVLRPQDLLNGDGLTRAGGLLPNWTFEIADSENKPAAILPIIGAGRESMGFRDANRNTLLVGSVTSGAGDSSVGYGFPAMPVNDKMTYRVTIRHRRVQAAPAPASGYYLRMFEAVAMDPGTTHVGYPGTAGCTPYSSLATPISNAAFPSTAWTIQTFDYTPTPGTNYMTVGHQNTLATSADVEIDYVLLTDDMPRVQHMNNAGRIIDGRGMPLNASGGDGVTISPTYPLSKPATNPHTSISVAATLVTMTGAATYSLPSATITGLTASTTYHVFRDLSTNTWVARANASSGLSGYFTSADRYLYISTQFTAADSAGNYSPPTPPPAGSGGRCPAPEVPVLLANATRDGPGRTVPAGEVVAGDWVWTQHEETLAWGAYPVLAAERHEDRERTLVRMADGRSLIVAALHRMYSVEHAWGFVRDVEPGETILGPRPGQLAAIEPAERGPVISFTIGEARTLITEDLLSHNAKPIFD